jgi:hypothetical protein
MHDEPVMDVARLGHVEVLTPKPEESLRCFVDMTESGRQGNSVDLGAWDDRTLLAQADGLEMLWPWPCLVPRPQSAGAAKTGKGARGLRL